MQLQVEKWIINKTNCEYSYHIAGLEKCCDKLINSQNITINAEYDEPYSVNLIHNEYYEWGEVCNDVDYEEILYCPFCGEKIEIEIIKEVDILDKYNELSKIEHELIYKRNHTDSKKEESELQNMIGLVQLDLNNMLSSDDFSRYKI